MEREWATQKDDRGPGPIHRYKLHTFVKQKVGLGAQ